eukprot:1228533-Rhodomonas_salina.1
MVSCGCGILKVAANRVNDLAKCLKARVKDSNEDVSFISLHVLDECMKACLSRHPHLPYPRPSLLSTLPFPSALPPASLIALVLVARSSISTLTSFVCESAF